MPKQGPPSPLTDSVWFWTAMFSLMALVGAAAISRKFDARQGQIEGRFHGRERAAAERERRGAGLPEIDLADTAREAGDGSQGRIVPLWTLMALAAGGAVWSFVMLAKERRRGRPDPRSP